MKNFIILNKQKGQIINWPAFRKMLEGLKDGKHLVEISGADKRSNQQNRYYFGLVIPLFQKGLQAKGIDVTKEETHEFLKARFNYSELVNESTGEFLQVPMSTTRLNKGGFSDYIGKIQQLAAEFLEIVIPDAGTQTILSYE